MGVRGFVKRVSQSVEESDRDRLTAFCDELGLAPLDALPLRTPVRFAGEITSLRIVPRAGAPAVEITVSDGRAAAVAVFLGRARVEGDDAGPAARPRRRGDAGGQRERRVQPGLRAVGLAVTAARAGDQAEPGNPSPVPVRISRISSSESGVTSASTSSPGVEHRLAPRDHEVILAQDRDDRGLAWQGHLRDRTARPRWRPRRGSPRRAGRAHPRTAGSPPACPTLTASSTMAVMSVGVDTKRSTPQFSLNIHSFFGWLTRAMTRGTPELLLRQEGDHEVVLVVAGGRHQDLALSRGPPP